MSFNVSYYFVIDMNLRETDAGAPKDIITQEENLEPRVGTVCGYRVRAVLDVTDVTYIQPQMLKSQICIF